MNADGLCEGSLYLTKSKENLLFWFVKGKLYTVSVQISNVVY